MAEKNKTGLDWEFVNYVRDHIRHGKTISEILPTQGPVIIERLLNLPTWETSLRQLAKDAKVSATYLSRIHRDQSSFSICADGRFEEGSLWDRLFLELEACR